MEDREAVQKALETVRPLLAEGQIALFLGEAVSSLPERYSSWKEYLETSIDNCNECLNKIRVCESRALKDPGCNYLYNTLRMVASWKGIINLNPDQLVEKLLWKGDPNVEKIRLDQLAQTKDYQLLLQPEQKLLIKIHGDTGLASRFTPELCDIFSNPPPEVIKLLHKLMDEYSFLFMGMDLEKHKTFFDRFVIGSKMKHYMLCRRDITHVETHGKLLLMCANLDLWEFAMYLSPGRMDKDLKPGQVYERSYLATQREEYLSQQLELESRAVEIVFHTVSITNALATVEELEKTALPKLADIHRQDPIGTFHIDNVQKTFKKMLGRRSNLLQLIDAGSVPVKALFFYESFLKEVKCSVKQEVLEPPERRHLRQMAVRKYADCVLRSRSVLKPNSTLEMYMVEGLSDEEMQAMQKETFALIKLKGGTDEAVCYAETARPGEKKLQTHLIVINGSEVANKRRVFERSLAVAWNHRESLLRLVAVLVEVEKTLHALNDSTLRQLESLHNVVAMLDHSIDSKSLVHLGGGSFGDVYKAIWNGIPVALKFLKDAARPEDIANFESEFRQLQHAQHENIVKVYKMTVENNQLGLIMEYLDGGNLRQLIVEQESLPVDLVKRCALQVASAINHLHELRMVHRDIKTDNILVSKDRMTFKLADFGLARVVERTEQYKTVKGTYRYMAPEILRGHDGAARYSLKVDVYSYGLCILEAMTGSIVFQELTKEQLEIGKREGRLTPHIPDSCEDKYGLTLVAIVRWSVSPVERRFNMSEILHILKTDEVPTHVDTSLSDGLSILCLGTGKGATAITHGEPSSSFVLLKDKKPVLLVDLGFGVASSYYHYLGKDANIDNIYITHNHGDHAAELPVLLAMLHSKRQANNKTKQTLPVIMAAPEVMRRLCAYRVNEVCSILTLEELAEWRVCEQYPHITTVDANKEFTISPLLSQHSEVCYGFLLYQRGQPLLGYTGDSGFNKDLYDHLFTAPNVIIDARYHNSTEHAGFSIVEDYVSRNQRDCRVFVTGYGVDSEFPDSGVQGCTQLRTGQEYALSRAFLKERTSVVSEYMSTLQGVTQ